MHVLNMKMELEMLDSCRPLRVEWKGNRLDKLRTYIFIVVLNIFGDNFQSIHIVALGFPCCYFSSSFSSDHSHIASFLSLLRSVSCSLDYIHRI